MDIAHGTIGVEVDDKGAIAALRAIDREFDRTFNRISHEKAMAQIDADIAPLEDAVKNARREVRRLQGLKASVAVDANTEELDKAIVAAKAKVRRLDGEKATIEVEYKADTSQLVAAHKLRTTIANEEKALEKSREKAATLEQRRQYERTVGLARENSRIVNLQKEYAKLTDKAERMGQRRAFTVEGHAKLELDSRGVIADMLRVKAELNALGAHPPAKIKIDIDRKDIVGRIKGVGKTILGTFAEKASGLSSATLRLGPFTASIKTAMTALAFLGPMLTDVAGAAGALIGVLGAGVAGAASVGAGAVTGLGMGFLGLKFALRNTGQEFTNVRAAMSANQKAIEKYGKGSDQQIKTQDALNHTLKTVSPLAREAALGVEKFYATWDKNAGPTRNAFGHIAKGAFSALNSITPMWTRQTNTLAHILDTNLSKAFDFMKGKGPQGLPGASEFKNDIKTIGDNFNHMMPSIMGGLGNLGRAFLNFGREGSKSFGDVGKAFEDWTQKVLGATQKDSFGDTVARWKQDGADVLHLLAAMTRSLTHFFGLGSGAGDKMLRDMTGAFNRWDRRLQGGSAKNVKDYFSGAVSGAQALYSAFAPIVELFALWSAGLSPAVKVISQIFAGVTHATEALGKFVGLQHPLETLGATFGAMWAVGKIGTFVSMLSRIPSVMKEIAASEGAFGALKSLFNGTFLGNLKKSGAGAGIAAEIEAGAAAGSAEFGAAIRGAATVGAAEFATAIEGASALGAGEQAVGGIAGGAIGGAEAAGGAALAAEGAAGGAAAAGLAEAGTAATVAEGAAAGLLGTSALLTGGLTLLGAAAVFAGYKILTTKNSTQKAQEAYQQYGDITKNAAARTQYLGKTSYGLAAAQAQATMSVRDAKKAIDQTKPGTLAHRNAMLQYRQSVMAADQAQQQWNHRVRDAELTTHKHTESLRGQLLAADKIEAAERKRQKNSMHPEENQKIINKAMEKEAQIRAQMIQSMNKEASTAANYARIWRGMPELTDKAAQSVGRLARQSGGKDIAKTISVKYKASSNVDKVASAASKTLASGVPKNIVSHITADSKNATENIRRLNNVRLTPKNLKIMESGGDKALARLRDLVGTKLAPKVQRILASDQDAHSKIKRLIALGIPPKVARIIGNDDDAKAKVREANAQKLRALVQMIGRIIQNPPNLFSALPAVIQLVKRVVTGHKADGGLAFAAGGNSSVPPGARTFGRNPNAAQQDRAAKTAALSGARATRGEKVTKPRYLVGEEATPEVVISTNPAYRKRNQEYVKMAASMVGMTPPEPTKALAGGGSSNGSFGGAGGGKFISPSKKNPNDTWNASKGDEFSPTKTLPRRSKKAKKKGKNRAYSTNRGWADLITNLHTQQDYWEREVSIRDSQIEEPESLVIVTGTKTMEDGTKVDQYGPNTAAIDTYKKGVAYTMEAITQLLQVIQALVQNIPLAMKAAQDEKAARVTAIGQLDAGIHTTEGKIKTEEKKDKKDQNSDNLKSWRHHLKVLQGKKDDNVAENSKIREDLKTLAADRPEAGFDFREAVISYNDYKKDYDSMEGKANTEAASQNANSTGGGSTGGNDPQGLSYGNQSASADAEKGSALKDFGENFLSGSNQARSQIDQSGGGGSPGGSGSAQANPAALLTAAMGGSNGSVAADLTAASLASSPGANAMQSGGQAATAMRQGASGGSGGAAATMGADEIAVGGNKTVIFNQTFNQQQDPHTFVKGVEFEVNSAI